MYRINTRCLSLNKMRAGVYNFIYRKEKSSVKKERRDVARSKEAIKQAFIKLCINKRTEKITVTKILEEANVSRGTFYAHFQDIYDVKEQVEEDLLNVCKTLLRETDIHEIVRDPYPQILPVVRFFAEYAEMIRHLSAYSESSFVAKYKRILLQGIQESEHTLDDETVVFLLDACIVGAIVDGCLQMIVQDQAGDVERAARLISQFIANGLRSFALDDGMRA